MKIKHIRFNLRFFNDVEESVRSLGELQEKFNVDDLYEYFLSGQLERWLRCHEEEKVADAVCAISKDIPTEEQLDKLFDALGFDFDENERKSAIASFVFPRRLLNKRAMLGVSLKKVSEAVDQNFKEYNTRICELIENREDFAKVKAGVRDLLRFHGDLFAFDYMRFYHIMVAECPLAIFAVLMNDKYRAYYLPEDENRRAYFLGGVAAKCGEKTGKKALDRIKDVLASFLSVTATYSSITFKVGDQQIDGDSYLLKDWNIVKQVSDYEKGRGAWQDEVGGEKKVMILCNDGVEVRPYHDNTRQFKPGEANGRFEIMNGFEYRVSNQSKGCLLYMEV